jgi:hypothetical protein
MKPKRAILAPSLSCCRICALILRV